MTTALDGSHRGARERTAGASSKSIVIAPVHEGRLGDEGGALKRPKATEHAPFGWFTAVRLAKPGSPWVHWFYEPERARPGHFERWFVYLVGGKPDVSSTSSRLSNYGFSAPNSRGRE